MSGHRWEKDPDWKEKWDSGEVEDSEEDEFDAASEHAVRMLRVGDVVSRRRSGHSYYYSRCRHGVQ